MCLKTPTSPASVRLMLDPAKHIRADGLNVQ
jgi:hypothetical protein